MNCAGRTRLSLFSIAILPFIVAADLDHLPRDPIPSRLIVSPQAYDAMGDGRTDDTAAIQSAIAKAKATGGTVHFPAGIYRIGEVLFDGANYNVSIDPGAVFRQRPGLTIDDAYHAGMSFSGSSIRVTGTIRMTGNIETDKFEYRPAVLIRAGARDIHIDSIDAQAIRGDALTVYGVQAARTSGIDIGSVTYRNVYRNGVSFIGGEGRIGEIRNNGGVGYRDLDVEPNLGAYQPVRLTVGKVIAASVMVVSDDPDLRNISVEIGVLDLDGRRLANSVPAYPSNAGQSAVALAISHVDRVQVGSLSLKNYASYPITLGRAWQYIQIDMFKFRNCDFGESVQNTIIRQSGTAASGVLSIGRIEGTHSKSNKYVMRADYGKLRYRVGVSKVTGGLWATSATGSVGRRAAPGAGARPH